MLPLTPPAEFHSAKIITFSAAGQRLRELKAAGKTVGLCHGGFDLLHPGHLQHFESAKKLCDVLIVSITSDRFVSSRKGAGRPVFPEQLRAYSVASLSSVDYVVITDFEKAIPIIETLQPSYYIKGPDFVGKMTPGITAEREAIARVGGEMKYTTDIKLSTTEIIEYIKNELDVPHLLLVIDRDGTLIMNDDFLGRNKDWKEELRLNEAVVSYLSYLQTKYKTTKIVVTNQAGVARGYFDCQRVEEINRYIDVVLRGKGLMIHNWQYCPEVEVSYAELKRHELTFVPGFVKEKTKRKPSSEMVYDALQQLQKKQEDFAEILMLGDRKEDRGLADNLRAKFIDVKGKGYGELRKDFS